MHPDNDTLRHRVLGEQRQTSKSYGRIHVQSTQKVIRHPHSNPAQVTIERVRTPPDQSPMEIREGEAREEKEEARCH